jgi:hypothetical protein
MVYYTRIYHHGRPYGTTTPRQRPHDSGSASNDTTDNGTQFTELTHFRQGADQQEDVQHPEGLYLIHAFDYACEQAGIEHRLTKPGHPWTNGQVERMNRTLKEATVKRYYYETHQQLKERLYNFLNAYNFAKRLKTLQGLTPYEYIVKCWQREPERFTVNPCHHTLGLNIWFTLMRRAEATPHRPAPR